MKKVLMLLIMVCLFLFGLLIGMEKEQIETSESVQTQAAPSESNPEQETEMQEAAASADFIQPAEEDKTTIQRIGVGLGNLFSALCTAAIRFVETIVQTLFG